MNSNILIGRIGFLVVGAMLLGASTSAMVEAQNRSQFITQGDIMAEKVTGHDVRLQFSETAIKQLEAENRELNAKVNTVYGMGAGLGLVVVISGFLQVLGYRTVAQQQQQQQLQRKG